MQGINFLLPSFTRTNMTRSMPLHLQRANGIGNFKLEPAGDELSLTFGSKSSQPSNLACFQEAVTGILGSSKRVDPNYSHYHPSDIPDEERERKNLELLEKAVLKARNTGSCTAHEYRLFKTNEDALRELDFLKLLTSHNPFKIVHNMDNQGIEYTGRLVSPYNMDYRSKVKLAPHPEDEQLRVLVTETTFTKDPE